MAFASASPSHGSPVTGTPSPDDDDLAGCLLTVIDGWEYCAISDDGLCALTAVSGTDAPDDRQERCTFQVEEPVVLNAIEFDTERDFDYLTLAGETYTGRRGPRKVLTGLGATFTWRSDRSVQR